MSNILMIQPDPTKIDCTRSIIQYEQGMGEMPAIAIDKDTLQRTQIGLTLSAYTHAYLMAIETMPGFYYRVKWDKLQGKFICSCKEQGCDHVKRHPQYRSAS
jgi:hypothetical protein